MWNHFKAFKGNLGDLEDLSNINIKKLFSISHYAEFYETTDKNSLNQQRLFTKKNKEFDTLIKHNSNYNIVFRDLSEIKFNNEINKIKAFVAPNLKDLNTRVCGFFSQPKSSIGYHADKSPVAIVQLKGQKHWKVWHKNSITSDELKLFNKSGDYHLKKSNEIPYIDVLLEPNDFLWIPEYFPHLATSPTDSNSLSISIIWDLVSFHEIVQEVTYYRNIPIPPILYKSYFEDIYDRVPLKDLKSLKKELEKNIDFISKKLNVILDKDKKNKIITNLILKKYGKNQQLFRESI